MSTIGSQPELIATAPAGTTTASEPDATISQRKYKKQMKTRQFWMNMPLALAYVVGPYLVQHYRDIWWLFWSTLFVFAWSFLPGVSNDSVFTLVQINLLLMITICYINHDESTLWAPVAATTLIIAMHQTCFLRQKLQPADSSKVASSSKYPRSTVPRSHAVAYTFWTIAISLLLWTHSLVLLRWTMQGLATLTASVALVLLVEFALFLGGVDGWWWSRQVMLDNYMASKTLCGFMMLVSMTSALLSSLPSDSWVRMAFFCTYSAVGIVAMAIRTADRRFQKAMEKVIAKGHFAPPTRRQATYAMTIFFASTLVMFLPLIVTLIYKSSQSSPIIAPNDDGWLIFLQLTAYVVTLACLLKYLRGPINPLHWTIITTRSWVHLSVATVGRTRKYCNAVDVSIRESISPLVKRSYMTGSIRHGGVIIVTYIRFTFSRHYNAANNVRLQVQMTPEDPATFLELMAGAIEKMNGVKNA